MSSEQTMSQGSPSVITGHGGNPPGQGPFITLRLELLDGIIRGVSYETYQCPGCHACGKAMSELAAGKSVEEARGIRHEHLLERVGPLPPHRRHCYGLALLALEDGLRQVKTESKRCSAVERKD